MKEKFFVILIILIAFSACKKQVEKERPEFIGYWRCDYYSSDYKIILNIDSNSNATYSVTHESGQSNVETGKARANDFILNIGRFHKFRIAGYPHMIDTTSSPIVYNEIDHTYKLASWKMTLISSQTLHLKGTFEFYKADY
jgi:hypothetical protein